MSNLFNTQEGELFKGVQSDLNKAKKGTPQYEAWLRKYKEKRPSTDSEETDAKKALAKQTSKEQNTGKETLKERKELAGVRTVTDKDVKAALDSVPAGEDKTVNVGGIDCTFIQDDESLMVTIPSHYTGRTKTAYYVNQPKDKLSNKELGVIASSINKTINMYPDEYLPHRDGEVYSSK